MFFFCSKCGGLRFKSAGQALTCFCHRILFSATGVQDLTVLSHELLALP